MHRVDVVDENKYHTMPTVFEPRDFYKNHAHLYYLKFSDEVVI